MEMSLWSFDKSKAPLWKPLYEHEGNWKDKTSLEDFFFPQGDICLCSVGVRVIQGRRHVREKVRLLYKYIQLKERTLELFSHMMEKKKPWLCSCKVQSVFN